MEKFLEDMEEMSLNETKKKKNRYQRRYFLLNLLTVLMKIKTNEMWKIPNVLWYTAQQIFCCKDTVTSTISTYP